MLGLGTKPGGEVAYRTDGGVAGAIGKADLAQCGVTPRNACAETKFAAWRRQAAMSLPASSRIAIAILTARSAGSGQGSGSLKNTMIPSPAKWSSVPSNWLTNGPKVPCYSRRKLSASSGSAVSVKAV